jgi:CRISPR-associated protein Cas2
MVMTVVVTRDVPDRFRGYLASCMCEIAPGVYTAPRMTAAVRERVWAVLSSWHAEYPACAIVMTWPDAKCVGGQAFQTLGVARYALYEHDDLCLVRRPLTPDEMRSLTTEECESQVGAAGGVVEPGGASSGT